MGINTNLRLVRAEVTQYAMKMNTASAMARNELANTAMQMAKHEFLPGSSGKGKVYNPAEAGGLPHKRTGNLMRSIITKKTNAGFNYQATVGPTADYARAVELGGKYSPRSWRGTNAERLGFPYMKPAWHKFRLVAPTIIKKWLG